MRYLTVKCKQANYADTTAETAAAKRPIAATDPAKNGGLRLASPVLSVEEEIEPDRPLVPPETVVVVVRLLPPEGAATEVPLPMLSAV